MRRSGIKLSWDLMPFLWSCSPEGMDLKLKHLKGHGKLFDHIRCKMHAFSLTSPAPHPMRFLPSLFTWMHLELEEIEASIRALPQSESIALGDISGIRCARFPHVTTALRRHVTASCGVYIAQVLCTSSQRSGPSGAYHHRRRGCQIHASVRSSCEHLGCSRSQCQAWSLTIWVAATARESGSSQCFVRLQRTLRF